MTSLMCVVKRLHMCDPRTTFVAQSAPLLAFHIPYWVCDTSRYGHAVVRCSTPVSYETWCFVSVAIGYKVG